MDSLVLANLIGFGTLLFAVTGLFFWNRAEGRADNRKINASLEENRREIYQLINAIHLEMKDFHGRLCSLEATRYDRKKP